MSSDDSLDPSLERIGHGHHMLRVMLETYDPDTGGETYEEAYVWFKELPVEGTRFTWQGTTYELLEVNAPETSYAGPANDDGWDDEE